MFEMVTLDRPAGLELDPSSLRNLFDREPFGFDHSLSGLDLFKFEELYALAEKYIGHGADYYVAGSAPRPDAVFFSVRAPLFIRTRRCSIGLLSRSLVQPEEKAGVWKRRVFWLPHEF